MTINKKNGFACKVSYIAYENVFCNSDGSSFRRVAVTLINH